MRNDIHSPKNIVPADYEFVAMASRSEDVSPDVEFCNHRHLTGATFSNHQTNGGCDVCGTQHMDYAIFHHLPTNKYITTGMTCASYLDSQLDDAFKAQGKKRRAANARMMRRQSLVAVMPAKSIAYIDKIMGDNWSNKMMLDILTAAGIEESPEEWTNTCYWGKHLWKQADIIRDIAGSATKKDLSEKQVAFLVAMTERMPYTVDKYNARKAEEAARKAMLNPVVEGRGVISGEVISVKFQENQYGGSLKMLVMDDRKFKVWGTVPAALEDVARGDHVTLTATLVKSDDDDTFGFYSRPAKASAIKEAE